MVTRECCPGSTSVGRAWWHVDAVTCLKCGHLTRLARRDVDGGHECTGCASDAG